MFIAAVAIIAAAVSPALAASCDTGRAPAVPVIRALPYEQARKLLLAGGWHGVTGHPHNDLSSNEVTFRDRGYDELQFCRLTADSLCRFAFAAGNVAMWVSTTGDENPLLDSKATVSAVRLACVGEPDPN